MKNLYTLLLAASLVGFACVGPARDCGFRVEAGKVVVESPFDLEIGSPEYAKALGDGIRSHADVRRDSDTGTMVTNWYHSGEARFSRPYFGTKKAWLSFADDDKSLSSVHFSVGKDSRSYIGVLTFNECRKMFDEIVADMSKRLGVKIDANDDTTEEDARESIEDCVAREKKGSSISVGFWNATWTVTNRFGDVEYLLSAMMHENKKCWISLEIGRTRHFTVSSALSSRDDGQIPVYTNKPHSADLSLRTPEQEKAHEEAHALRAAIKRVFGVDLDAPSVTNDMSAALVTQTNRQAKAEWFPLERPFAGCTERRADTGTRMLFVPMTTFAIRHAFDGYVGEDELKAESSKILDALESEFGGEIPAYDIALKEAAKDDEPEAEPPAFGDIKALLQIGRACEFFFRGGVGDISIVIKYAQPSYVKRNGNYEVALRGAVVAEISQSSFLAQMKKRKAESNRKGDR